MENKPPDPHSAEPDISSLDATNDSHAFVIRIWLEDIQSDETSALWRGHITHVLDHRQHYFQDLSGIVHFITPYIDIWTTKIPSPKS
ncbi:MAG: hypothetical protein IAF02_14150 [Anaerolineae bacterium]|nr:hypothetical protein [Anaerolineae bacterium]